MKKIILGIFVFVLLLVGVSQANASVVDDLLAQVKSLKTELSLLRGNQGASVLDAIVDTTPRIMYWSGKINQHIDLYGVWQTDPDGKSGATIDKLTYCKKFWPNTVSVEDYMNETIDTWRAGGNSGAYSSTKMSTKCVEGGSVLPDLQADIEYVREVTVDNVFKINVGAIIKNKGSSISDDFMNVFMMASGYNGTGDIIYSPKEIPVYGLDSYKEKDIDTNDKGGDFLVEHNKKYSFRVCADQEGKAYGSINDIEESYENNNCSSWYNFTTSSISTPSITVIAPNESNSFLTGNDVPLSWSSTGFNSGAVVDVSYSSCSDRSCPSFFIQQGLNPTGKFTWKANVNPGFWFINFDLRSKLGVGSYTLESKNVRIYVGSSSTPSITVLAPNGGETYSAGQQITVTWKSENIPTSDYVQIGLSDLVSKKDYQESIVRVLNSGKAILTLPTSDIIFGKRYNIDIYTVKGEGYITYADKSDNYFSIVQAPVAVVKSPCAPYGDVDNDGYLTSKDITLMSQKIAGTGSEGLTYDQHKRADVNQDGVLTSMDITLIKNVMSGVATTFPVCPSITAPLITVSELITGRTGMQGTMKIEVSEIEIKENSGSDISINNLKLELGFIEGNGSNKWDSYFDKTIEIYENRPDISSSKIKVGEALLSNFSKNTNGSIYSGTVPLSSSAIVKKNSSNTFSVIMKGLPMGDVTEDSIWHFNITSVRFTDDTGLVTQVSSNNKGVDLLFGYNNTLSDICYNGAINYPLCTISTTAIDTGCLPGYVYSSMTGKLCPNTTVCSNGAVNYPLCTNSESSNVCSANILTQKLQLRSTGPQVKILQEMLNSFGFLSNSGIDSKFGYVTRQAVMNYQIAHSIYPVDGVVSMATMNSLNTLWQVKCMSTLSN
jgi:hypothetical protein